MAYSDKLVAKYAATRDRIGKEIKKSGALRPGNGLSTWRIIPAEEDQEFFVERRKHFVAGEPVFCNKSFGKPCAVCDVVSKLREEGESSEAYEIAGSTVFLFRAVDRKAEDEGPQWAEVKRTVMHGILGYICDPEYGDILDIEKGRDVKIERTGTGRQGTRYDVRMAANPSPLHKDPDRVEEWLEAAPSFDTQNAPSDERIQTLLDKAGLLGILDAPPFSPTEQEEKKPESMSAKERIEALKKRKAQQT